MGLWWIWVHAVLDVINEIKFPQTVDWPDDIIDVVFNFSPLAQMNLVVGIVDGTHIPIDAPTQNEQQYVDRHGDHSINVMAVCRPDSSVGPTHSPGSVHDPRVYRNSTLHRKWVETYREGGVILGDSG